MITLISLCYNLLVGIICARYAIRLGRRPHVWFYVGVFTGLAGLLTLYLFSRKAPKKTSPTEPRLVTTEPKQPDPRLQNWFFVDSSKVRQGPVPFRRLFIAWRDQHISYESLVWTEGMSQWEPISKLPTLLDKLN